MKKRKREKEIKRKNASHPPLPIEVKKMTKHFV